MAIEHLEASYLCYQVEEVFKWPEWVDKIPYIQFPAHWKVKAVPPYSGAMIRYHITTDNIDGYISVYLDCYGMLGREDEPYWEVYPTSDGEPSRCLMNEIDELLELIKIGLDGLRK